MAEVRDFIDPITLDENGRALGSWRCWTTACPSQAACTSYTAHKWESALTHFYPGFLRLSASRSHPQRAVHKAGLGRVASRRQKENKKRVMDVAGVEKLALGTILAVLEQAGRGAVSSDVSRGSPRRTQILTDRAKTFMNSATAGARKTWLVSSVSSTVAARQEPSSRLT